MKKMNKRIGTAMMASMMAAACMSAGVSAEEKTMTIGLIPQSTLFVFYDYVQKGANDAAEEAGYTINYQGTTTDTDGTGQRKIVEDMLVTGIDALAISATNADAVSDLLQSMEVPVIAWDCGLDTSSCKTVVSVDHYKASAAVADYVMEKCPDGGLFAVISTNAGNAVIQDREKGFMETLAAKEGFECIGPFYTDGDLEKTANTMQDLLMENEDLKGVFMVNEGTTEGACQTIKNEGREDLLVFGYDTSESLINYVYDGVLDGMVSQNPYGLGYNAVKQAIAAAEGQEEFPEFIENESVLITSDNIHDEDIIQILDPIGTMNLE
ncbi:MAG: substrate-binding domain-containing protein [Eubacteriales bacterium]|nr:substrate-binding domain-containing protein [Eubacteriales bacterium]